MRALITAIAPFLVESAEVHIGAYLLGAECVRESNHSTWQKKQQLCRRNRPRQQRAASVGAACALMPHGAA